MSFETLILDNIEVLGYNHQNNFLGEKSFQYSTTKTLSIRGYVLDLTNTVGVKDIFTDVNRIKNIAQNFYNIIIKGQNFGIGKITSLSFDEGNWVRSTKYNADIEIYTTANLQSLVSKEFISSNYIVSNTSGASPNLSGYKFYKTNQILNSRPIYYDTTNIYALWNASSTQWRISPVTGVGSSNTPRFQRSSSEMTPPTGITFLGFLGFAGNTTLAIDNDYILNLSNKRFDLIKSFSENFTFDFDNNTKILGGTHSIDIEYNADNKDINVITLAQSLAVELLNKSIPINLSEYNYSTRQEGTYKVLRNESYDIINGKCGFTKTFSYSTNNNLEPYSINRNLNISLDNNGIANVGENCSIKAENNIPSLYENAVIGLNKEITGAYLRCNNFFQAYKNKFNIIDALNTVLAEKTVRINKFDGNIEYDVSFNNDKKFSKNYIFDYTSTLNRNEQFIWSVNEQGSIIGVGEKNSIINSAKYLSAETGWAVVKTGIESRLKSFWSGQALEKASSGINLIDKQITRTPFDGKITYNYTYTDDPTIRTDLGDIKKLDITYSDDGSSGTQLTPYFKKYIIPNNKYELVHNRDLKQQGTFTIEGKADIGLTSQTGIFNGLLYFDTLKTQLRNYYFGGNSGKYLESCNFTSDEIEQIIGYEEVYKYS